MNEKKGVYIEGNYLVLNIRYPYDIQLSRIDTPTKAHEWVIHLMEKNWITREILFEMVDLLEKHFGYSLHNMAEAAA